jgi:hypothetical protein
VAHIEKRSRWWEESCWIWPLDASHMVRWEILNLVVACSPCGEKRAIGSDHWMQAMWW